MAWIVLIPERAEELPFAEGGALTATAVARLRAKRDSSFIRHSNATYEPHEREPTFAARGQFRASMPGFFDEMRAQAENTLDEAPESCLKRVKSDTNDDAISSATAMVSALGWFAHARGAERLR
jgi:hypothetical protein